jgi:type IV pilus assembly protein PilC
MPLPSAMSSTNTLHPDYHVFVWTGMHQHGHPVQGEMHAPDAEVAAMMLQRQGITIQTIKKQTTPRKQRITEKDIAVFTRQLATMLKAGMPMLQAFDIVIHGQQKATLSVLLSAIRADIASGISLQAAFRQYPAQFSPLYCSLVAAGEQAGVLETLLERLALHQEKALALKYKMKSAIVYPISVLCIALIVTVAIMVFVIPTFKTVFADVNATLPTPTLIVIALSDLVVHYGLIILGMMGIGATTAYTAWRRSAKIQQWGDRQLLRLPLFGHLLKKALWTRWSRTLATLCAAGIPITEALITVAPTCGNRLYQDASMQLHSAITQGSNLAMAIQSTGLFPHFMIQMVAVGEESGTVDQMLHKVADFYEIEVDESIATLSTMLEPFIIVLLGIVIGSLVIALYLPIFKLGTVL